MSTDTEYVLVHLAIVVPSMAILLIALGLRLRRTTLASNVHVGFWLAVFVAGVGLLLSLLAAGAVGYAVMFGPSHLTGDFIGLPWFTMFPALAVSLWVMARVNKAVTAILLRRSNLQGEA